MIIKIKQATESDKYIIEQMAIELDKYHYKTCNSFAENVNKNSIDFSEQARKFMNSVNIEDFYILKLNNIPIGNIMVWDNNGEITLINFYIDKKYRNKGYGTKLLDYIMENIKTEYCVLSVFEENKKSLEFYYHYGFTYMQTEETDSGKLLWLKKDRRKK